MQVTFLPGLVTIGQLVWEKLIEMLTDTDNEGCKVMTIPHNYGPLQFQIQTLADSSLKVIYFSYWKKFIFIIKAAILDRELSDTIFKVDHPKTTKAQCAFI